MDRPTNTPRGREERVVGEERVRVPPTATGPGAVEYGHDGDYWRDHTRIFLRPVASPVVLGWLAWACAAFVIAADMAWGYAGPGSLVVLGPYIMFMGLAQLLAAAWGYNARDTLVTGFHGVWGATWLGIGLIMAFVAPNQAPAALSALFGTGGIDQFAAIGYIFVATGAVSLVLAPYGLAKNLMTGLTMAAVGVASVFVFLEAVVGGEAWTTVAGWVYMGAIVGALIIAGATSVTYAFNAPTAYKLLGPATGREAVGDREGRILVPVEHGHGEPGVRQGEGAHAPS